MIDLIKPDYPLTTTTSSTTYMDLTFKPIPKSCPVPPNTVALVGGICSDGPTFALWKDRQEIIIEAPRSDEPYIEDPDDPYSEWRAMEKIRRRYAHFLEIIETLLPTIEFGKTNWAYLLPAPNGGHRILHKEKKFPQITCPAWAPLIYLDEIEFTVWGICSDRRGIWKGKEVDITYAWNRTEFWRLNRAMYGYRAVQGLDLTFEVYGHLVGRDGSIIGLVSEAAWGRMIEPSDRVLIYQTIARIQRRGCIYKGCYTNRFMIADGKVRLIELNCITPYQDMGLLEKEAEVWHWKELEDIFMEFDRYGPYGLFHLPPLRFTTSYKDLRYIRPLPSPDRPFGGLFLYPEFFEIFPVDLWPGYRPLDKDDEKESVPPLTSQKRRPRRPISLLIPDFDEPYGPGTARGDVKSTQRIDSLSIRSHSRAFPGPFHPYYRPRHYKPSRALTNSDNTASSVVSVE